jgi:hypothetical protein
MFIKRAERQERGKTGKKDDSDTDEEAKSCEDEAGESEGDYTITEKPLSRDVDDKGEDEDDVNCNERVSCGLNHHKCYYIQTDTMLFYHGFYIILSC